MTDAHKQRHADTRHAVEALAAAWSAYRVDHPDGDPDTWFKDLRRMIEARATTLGLVQSLGAMGGGGADEA